MIVLGFGRSRNTSAGGCLEVYEPLEHEAHRDVAEEFAVGEYVAIAAGRGRREVNPRPPPVGDVVHPYEIARKVKRRRFAAKQHHRYLCGAEETEDFAVQPTIANPREEHARQVRTRAHLGEIPKLLSGLKRRIRP